MDHAVSDPYSRYSINASDNDIAAIINILYERKMTILFFFCLFVFLSLFYVTQAKKQYVASAKIMLTPADIGNKASTLQTLLSTGKLDIADLLSQVEIIKSPEIVRNLVIDKKLYNDVEFGGATRFLSLEEITIQRQRAIIDNIKNRLSVNPVLGTSIVEISFQSSNAKKASQVVNAIIDVYGQNEDSRAKVRAKTVSDWLAERLETLEKEVRDAEMSLERAREKNNLNLSQSEDSRLIRIELLTKELSIAQAEKAETGATLQEIITAKKGNLRVDAIPNVLGNKVIENFKFEEARLLKRKAVLEQKYGSKHPAMIAFRAEFNGFKSRLDYEIDTIFETLKSQASIAQKRIDALNSEISKYRASYQGDAEQRLEVRNLKTSADTARTLLNSFTKSYLESLQNLKLDKSPIRLISEATPPQTPIFPKKSLIIILSGVTGLFLGMFVALLMERMQSTLQFPEQIEKMISLPVYGVVPYVRFGKNTNAADYILQNPASPLSELMRTLFTTIQLRNPYHKSGGRTLTVTSTLSGEGKTTNAIWLATTAAQNGKKVLLMDADMRRPSVHKAYGIGNSKGLADYLSDRLTLDETIYRKHASGVHIMTSKAIPTHALTLLNSERMETLLRRLQDAYDLIIIDVPTALVFSDSLVMAKMSDKTLYVVESKKTKRDDLQHSVKQFTDMGYKDLCFVMNKVEDRKLSRFMKKAVSYNSKNV